MDFWSRVWPYFWGIVAVIFPRTYLLGNVGPGYGKGSAGLILGKDGRLSTSKFQFFDCAPLEFPWPIRS